MKPLRGYLPKDEIYPLVGLNTLEPSPQADPRTSPACENVLFTKGVVQKRGGYQYLGDELDSTAPVIGIVEYEGLTGTKTLLAFTTKRQYKWSGTAWTDITYRTGGAGTEVEWTGAETDTFDYAILTGFVSGTLKKYIVITNGKDAPRFWDGDAARFAYYQVTGISGVASNSTSWAFKSIIGFYDHVLIGNIKTDAGTWNSTLICWAQFQDLVTFTTGGAVDSGTAILTDVDGELLKFERLADRCYLYGLNTIHSCTYVAGALVYVFEKVAEGTRLLSKRSVVNIGAYHLFMSQENVVFFDGTRMTREVGDRISKSLRDELYASKRHFAFAFHDAAKRQVYFSYPTGVSSSKQYHVEYASSDLLNGKWTKFSYADRITAMGFYSRNVDLAYDSAQFNGISYYGSSLRYAQGSIKGGFPIRILGTSSSRVATYDDTIQNDANTAVDAYWDSIDFTVPTGYQSELGRWIEIELELQGYEADIYYSTDKGETYKFVEKLNLTSGWEKYRVLIDVMSKTFRVRIANNCPSSMYQHRWIRLWVQPGGPA